MTDNDDTKTDLDRLEYVADVTMKKLEEESNAIVDGRSERSLFEVEKRITHLTTFKHYIGLKRRFETHD